MGCIRTTTTRLGCGIKIATSRIGGNVKVQSTLVCQVNLAKNFVKVRPDYIWLTSANHYTDIVLVSSDIDWKAE